MPRYAISDEDLEDLIAYLKRLESDLDPGLTEQSIKVGSVLPLTGPLKVLGQAMRDTMEAYISDINAQGGINKRKIEQVIADYGDNEIETAVNIRELIKDENVFVFAGAFISGADSEIVDFMEREKVPLIGPFSLFTPDISMLNIHTFYLFSGLVEQGQALVDYSAQNLNIRDPRVVVVFPDGFVSADIAETIKKQCRKHGWNSVSSIKYSRRKYDAPELLRRLNDNKASVVSFFGSWRELDALIKEAGNMNRSFYVLASGSIANREIFSLPASFQDKIYLSYPSLPSDRTQSGIREFNSFIKKHKLSLQHPIAQIHAYLSLKILVEGLKRAGRDVSREKLVTSLEGIVEFETGLSPPITYSANRRVGVLGAYVVAVDLAKKSFRPSGGWIKLEE